MRKIQPAVRAYLQISLPVPPERRDEAITKVFLPSRQRFDELAEGAVSIDLLVRNEDLQVLAGFDTLEHARAFEKSPAGRDLTGQLTKLAEKEPTVALYNVD
ncbi:MAG: hypothetical protein WDA20_04590 [Desulfuromonadales bacterium]